MATPERPVVDDLYWEDCTDTLYSSCAVAQGDGYWPSLISLEAPQDGTITADNARELAAMLSRAADACDESNRKLFPAGPISSKEDKNPLSRAGFGFKGSTSWIYKVILTRNP